MNTLLPEQPFVSIQTVRITDINYGNHLGHDRLISLLHQARIEALAVIGASELDFYGTALILAKLAVVYRAQAFLHDVLHIAMWLDEVKASRFVLHYKVMRENILIAEAETTMVCFDYNTQRAIALPLQFVEVYRHE